MDLKTETRATPVQVYRTYGGGSNCTDHNMQTIACASGASGGAGSSVGLACNDYGMRRKAVIDITLRASATHENEAGVLCNVK